MEFSSVRRFFLLAFTASVIAALLAISASAQSVSGATGVVSDANGAPVPNVKVTLTDTKTAREVTTVTNDEGSYTFNNIAPGANYRLSFAASGFQTTVMNNVTLGVAKTETYNAVLTAGDVSATVDVAATGSGDTLNTTDASIGNVIDTRQLRELPIQIRSSPAALIGLQPGVVGNNVGTTSTNRVGSVIGSRADQGNITVDGIDANDQATGQFAATVGNAPIDAIQEFRAVTVNPAAAEGRSSGGQVELVTKSGTNNFHGSLREYNRNTNFAANSFFNNRAGRFVATDPDVVQGRAIVGDERVPRPKLNRNQFGGNLGGPLPFPNFGNHDPHDSYFKSGKDRLFFFFDYEGRRDAQDATYNRIVPLNHFRTGGLAYISGDPTACAGARLNTKPECITILTPAQVTGLDPAGIGPNAALLSLINSRYPAANDFSVGDGLNTAGFRFNTPTSRQDDTYTTRFDVNINSRQKAFVRFNIARRNQTDTVNFDAAEFPGDTGGHLIVQKDYSIAAGHSWSITNNLFNQLTIGNSHSGLDFPNTFDPSFPNQFAFGTVSAPFLALGVQNRIVDTPTIRDDMTMNWKSHTFFFGGSFKPIKSVSGLVNDVNFPTLGLGGNLDALDETVRPGNISSGVTNYDASLALLLGRFASMDTNFTYDASSNPNPLGTGKTRDFRYNEYEYYFQDNWKLRSDLTINLGLRYQYYSPPYEANGFQAGNDVDIDSLLPLRIRNAANGVASDTSEPLLTYTLIGKGNDGRPYYKGDKNNFAPRVGFAYSPSFSDGFMKTIFGDRKTSIRGGAAMVYDRTSGGLTFIQDQLSYLFDNSNTLVFGTGDANTDLLNDPRFTGLGTLPFINSAPVITNPNTPFVVGGSPVGNQQGAFNYAIAQNFKTPYSYQYSIGFQRELPGDFLLDVSYAGRLGKKLFAQADASQVLNFKDPASGQTLFDALNAVQAELNAGRTSGQVTQQPFFTNQMPLGAFGPCEAFAGVGFNCTRLAAALFGSLISRGDSGDTVQGLFANGLLRPNVGISGQFSDNVYITNLGKSRYDGLLVSLQKRFSHGLQFDLNYTYSFSKDNNSSVANTVIGGLIYDLTNPNVGRGPSDFDIRHLVNANFIYELPFGHGKWLGKDANGFVNTLIGGWQVSGIYTYRSGLPFSVLTNSFPLAFTLESPAVLSGDLSALQGAIDASGPNVNFFGNTAAAAAALAAFRPVHNGETGSRNVLRGPSFWSADLGLAKNFALPWEGQRIQVRMDAFNAFNHNVFANPGVSLNGSLNFQSGRGLVPACSSSSPSCAFGQITTSASNPREIQFAIRWDF